jgi:hypothetical protein
MQLPSPHPDVIYKPVTEGAVLLSTEDEVYYGLNAVGARVWELLPPVLTRLDELCSSLSEVYPDIGSATIHADVQALLDDLLALGLVRRPEVKGQHANQARPVAQAPNPDCG